MNYKHAYHAGNFADVVKHILLLQLLSQFSTKAKPFYVLDAYGGRGLYSLASTETQKTQEAQRGVVVLEQAIKAGLDGLPKAVSRYLSDLAFARQKYDQYVYPGSPWWIAHHGEYHSTNAPLRAEAFETVADEYDALNYQLYQLPIGIHHRDAFEGVRAVIPPKEKRGIILLDPPFEQEHKDFSRLVDLLVSSHKKFATGTFVLWYPIKNIEAVELFYKKMKRTGIKKQLVCELNLYPNDVAVGLNGTGLLVINPPWQFADNAQEIIEFLAPILKPKDAPQMTLGEMAVVKWLVAE
ncbi:23S rRNA (adenine(2030)-N(6))-methyltransferase RlmJ [Moraxella catarrhalis]|uniref:Ribosomal RNA large subunit methyltransferase J n=1 Tax=Moraxella catarrhalis TaxID=480 RepID=A0AB36DQB1_MORCA|nr:23S rRNA (adenine(2030)-N(6))-methyltransferase RlmJ [Moraxella catarrhalis]MPX28456.1 23S rRNA (adenine(2030)-N(6))-methyltransferase RlmJ [Moraxella catarrhalis]OAV26800.1 Protein involved in catabolism of external DNA [Moraxella catarrhalis]RKL88235.1 23S rRNA (adenine(2030)-N(6))-methyltransferase RlmJ [Moraxella catarrhalis]RKL90047.1 23S rRNA (adenine(2030)-N(6))-methyltransferase RlmJ [Moraxella catarrhalis]RKM00616.1 23S rRNA (adenine(2030)-N(6))-methyltransferase RlmJ [Moraxella ca